MLTHNSVLNHQDCSHWSHSGNGQIQPDCEEAEADGVALQNIPENCLHQG